MFARALIMNILYREKPLQKDALNSPFSKVIRCNFEGVICIQIADDDWGNKSKSVMCNANGMNGMELTALDVCNFLSFRHSNEVRNSDRVRSCTSFSYCNFALLHFQEINREKKNILKCI